jgi:hypothetical protein
MVRRTAPHLSISPMIQFVHLRLTNRFFLLHGTLEIINNMLVLSTPCASDRPREGLRRARVRPGFGCQNMRKYCTCPRVPVFGSPRRTQQLHRRTVLVNSRNIFFYLEIRHACAETFSAQMVMKGSGIQCSASRIAETFSAPTRRVAATQTGKTKATRSRGHAC